MMGMHCSCAAVLMICILINTGGCFLNIPVNDKAKNEEKVNVHVIAGKRVKRSIETNDFPETYDLELTLNGSKLHVHLEQNTKVQTCVPVWTLKGGSLKRKELNEKEESAFYQDSNYGAVFTVQKNSTGGSNMVGVLQVGNEDFVLQSNDDLSNGQTNSSFRITKEPVKEVTFSDFDKTEITVPTIKPIFNKRRKRATGDYQVELLVVVDFSIFQYWYDLSTASTIQDKETDSIETIRQFYAFVINGMDAMYKNIQTSDYTLSVVFSGIVIAQTPSDSSWTENIKNTGVSPFQVDSSNGLSNFSTWVRAQLGSLPGHDHAMLFTKYDLTSSGSTTNAGKAYLGTVCTSSSQSIVEDHFAFILLTVASHELGHSLNSQHDGTGNACSASDYYIMGPSTSPQQSSATATHPWIFSTCSTSYFTNKIVSLEWSSSNCLATLDSAYNASALSQYDNQLPGQIYDADAQCVHIRGPGSYFCKDRYNSDFTTICNVLWCADPATPRFCYSSIAADGTHCGNQKWCKTGVCVYDAQAPTGVDSCLYGDTEGQVFSNQPWNCSEVAIIAPHNCPLVPVKCCDACAPYLPSTTTTQSTGTGTTASPPTTPAPTTVPIQLSDADLQCEAARGNGSFLCRSLYNGDYSIICTTMWCSNPSDSSSCQSVPASDGTLCGNQKWCISSVCTADSSAPVRDETCLYGDRRGAVFTNGWTCADMVANAPNNCPSVPVQCCASCAPQISTTTQSSTPSVQRSTTPVQLSNADLQCEAALGVGSFLCRSLYNGNFSTICSKMWCSSPTNSSVCQSVSASDETLCGNQKWCLSRVCTADIKAPSFSNELCLYGDRKGAFFSNGWTCAEMVTNAPNNCPTYQIDCCASCATYLTTSSTATHSTPKTSILTTSQPSTPPTTQATTSKLSTPLSTLTSSQPSTPPSTPTTSSQPSSPPSASTTTSQLPTLPTTTSHPSTPLSTPATTSRPSTLLTKPTTISQPSTKSSTQTTSNPSTPLSTLTISSQPSTPPSTLKTTSQPSTPPSVPTTTTQLPTLPTTTSQPSTPLSTPTTTSRPSTLLTKPTTISQPSTTSSTQTTNPSTPLSTLTTTSQQTTPTSTLTTTSKLNHVSLNSGAMKTKEGNEMMFAVLAVAVSFFIK